MNRYDCVFFDSGGTLYGVFDAPGVPTPEDVAAGRSGRVAALLAEYGAAVDRRELERALERCQRECAARLDAALRLSEAGGSGGQADLEFSDRRQLVEFVLAD